MAAEAIGLHVELEVLDPVLALPAPGVKLVKLLRICAPGGNEEAGVSPLLHRLGLVDDPALMLPASGLVETFREELHLLPFGLVTLLGLIEQISGHLLEARVGWESHRVGYALPFAIVVEGRNGEADQRMIDVLLVVAVVVATFLIAVGGICSSIEVE